MLSLPYKAQTIYIYIYIYKFRTNKGAIINIYLCNVMFAKILNHVDWGS